MDEQRAWLKGRRKRRLRILAVMLSFCVLFTTYPDVLETFSVSVQAAAESAQTETQHITGFIALSDEVREQTVPLGTALSELTFPDTLGAVVTEQQSEDDTEKPEDDGKKDSEENDGKEPDGDTTGTGDKDGSTGETEAGEPSDTEQGDTAAGGETEDNDTETGDGEDAQPGGDGESEETDGTTATENGNEADTETEENTGESAPAEATQETNTVTMPEYLTENVISVRTLEDTQTEKQEETVTISGITWRSDPSYDGDTEGVYTFTPVLPDGYALAEGASLPEIKVTVDDTVALIRALLGRIAALPDAQEYMGKEPDIDDWEGDEDDYEEAYTAWMEGLQEYAGEALAIWEEYEALTEEQQAQMPEEELAKLTAWMEIAEQFSADSMVMAAASGTDWTLDDAGLLTITSDAGMSDWKNKRDTYKTQVKRVVIESGVTSIALSAFYQCSSLTSITIPNSVTGIETSAFSGCSSLTSITIPNGVTDIKSSAFYKCSSLTSITIPNSVTNIESGAFRDCSSLTDVVVQGGTPATVGNSFPGCKFVNDGLKAIKVPRGCVDAYKEKWSDYAQYIKDEYAVTYEKNGGMIADEDNYLWYTEGEGMTLPEPEKTGYTFGGWYTNPGFSGSPVTSIPTSDTEAKTYYAKWTAKTYTVTFDKNGGNAPSKASQSVTYDSTYGTLATVSRTGYNFDGWYTTATGGDKVESTTKVTTAGDHTLYAHWTVASHTVTFNANGGDAPSKASMTVTNGSAYGTLATVSRTGYRFDGWYTAKSGGDKVESTTTVTATGDHTLYAHWTAKSYTVTFNKNGGDTPSKASQSVIYDSAYGDLATVSRTGYSFAGWYTAISGGSKVESTTTVTTAGDHTLYAHWTKDIYKITYTLDGGTLPSGMNNPTSYTVEDSTFTLNNPEKTGYTFAGWSGTGLTSNSTNVTIKKGSTGNRSYTANWTADKYTITYKGIDGATLTTKPTQHTYGTATTIGNPTKTGYTFVGWKVNNGGTATKDLTLSGTSYTAAITLTATWTANTYTVTYKGNENTGGSTADSTHTYDAANNLTANGYTRSYDVTFDHNYTGSTDTIKTAAYTFGGWNTASNGSGTSYNDQAPVKNLTSTNGGTVTLYAKWTPASVNDTPAREGYTFEGWYTDSSCSGSRVDSNGTYTPTADITLYACWKDAVPPSAPTLQSGAALPEGWTKTQAEIPLTFSDNVGVTELLVSTDGGNTYTKINGFTGGSGTITYNYDVSEGDHTYLFKAKDAAGNESEASPAFTVRLDTTAPVIGELSYENKAVTLWNWIIGKTSMVIHVPVTDNDSSGNAGSGVSEITYTMTPEGGSAQEPGTAEVRNGEAKITFAEEFKGSITITCTDAVGNTADSKTVSASGGVVVEDTPPVVTLALPQTPQPNDNGWYSQVFDITVTVTDAEQAEGAAIISGGIARIEWKDGENGAGQTVSGLPGDSPVYEKTFPIPVDTDGIHTYYVQATDNAGNESGWEPITVKLDRGNPVFSADPTVKDVTADGAVVTVTPSEGGKVYWIVDPEGVPESAQAVVTGAQGSADNKGGEKGITGGTPADIDVTDLTPGAAHKVYVVLEDAAGNLSVVKEVAFGTLPKAPVITLDDLIKDYDNETIEIPEGVGEVEVYTNPDNPSGSKIEPGADGTLPVEPGKPIYIRYPEKTEGSVTVRPSEGVKIDIPARPAAPPAKEVTVTDTTVTVKSPSDEEEYILVEKGSLPEGAEPDWNDADKVNESGVFTGLDPNKEYDLYVRKKATDSEFASESAKTEVRTYVTINEPVITGDGAGEDGNTAPRPERPDEGGDTVTFTGTYGEEYTPVIKVGEKEIIPGSDTPGSEGSEMTWDEEDKKGEWKYVYPVPDGASETEDITVEFRKRAVTGITAQPESLTLFADDAVNQDAVEAGDISPLTAYLKGQCSVKAAYDNRTTGEIAADAVSYTTTDAFASKGSTYHYTISAGGRDCTATLTVIPVNARAVTPDGLKRIKKPGGYTKEEAAAWLPAEVIVTYTGTGYTERKQRLAVTWDTAVIGSDFGGTLGKKTISGTVTLPAWATGDGAVNIEIEFIDKYILTDGQMQLSVPDSEYGTDLPDPQGNVTVTDTNPSYIWRYSADGGTTWVTADHLPKSGSGHVVPGGYKVKMTYTGDSYTGIREASFTVTRKTVTAEKGTLEAVSRKYDGTTDAVLEEGGEPALSGAVAGDDVKLGGTLEAHFAEKGPKKDIPVNVTGFALEGRDIAYYELGNETITLYATISKVSSGGGSGDNGSDNNGDNGDNSGGSTGDGNNSGDSNGDNGNGGGGNKPGDGKKPDDTTKPGDGTKPGGSNGDGGDGDGTKPGGNNGGDGMKPGGNNGGGDGKTSDDNNGDGSDGTKSGSNNGGAGDSTKPGDGSNPVEGETKVVPVVIEDGRIVIGGGNGGADGITGGSGNDGEGANTGADAAGGTGADGAKIATGNVPGMAGAGEGTQDGSGTAGSYTASTMLQVGEGAVIVRVVCEEPKLTAGVADTVAVANAVLTTEQIQLVGGGDTIEIRVEVKDITGSAAEQDQEVIESAVTSLRREQEGMVLGMYVDISMFVKVGGGEWNAVTESGEPVEVVIGIPEEIRADGRAYYVIRSHEGEYDILTDMDDVPDTITISTDKFSAYAIAYAQTDSAQTDSTAKCGLCHICPTFLGICYFIWLAFILAVIAILIFAVTRRKKEEPEGRNG